MPFTEFENYLQPDELTQLSFGLDQSAIIAVTDVEGKIVHVNKLFCDISGYQKEELIGQDHRLINSGFHSKDFIKNLWRTIAQGKVWKGEIRNKTKEGSYYWVFTSIVPILNASGKPYRYLSIRFDITEKKLSEEKEKSAAALLSYVENIQSEFISTLSHNNAFELMLKNLLEYSGSEYGFIGEVIREGNNIPYLKTHSITNISWNKETRDFYEQNAPQGMEFRNLNTLFGRVLESGEPLISDDPYTDPRRGGLPEGHPPLTKFIGIPVKKGNRMVGMIGLSNKKGGYSMDFIQEVMPIINTCANLIDAVRTEKRRMETENILVEKNEELRRMNESLESFVYRVSHDLKSPAINIGNMLKMLRDNLDKHQQNPILTQVLSKLQSASGRLIQIVGDLLDISKLEVSKSEPKEFINLKKEFEVLMEEYDAEIKASNAQIHIDAIDKQCVFLPKIEIHSILQNLLSNSLKYRDNNRQLVIWIRVSTSKTHCSLSFSDNGIGIDTNRHKDKLFKMFERFHSNNTIEGTGVGLYILKKIVEKNDGMLTLESELGKGTTVTIELPLNEN
ncbi:MAG: ATP-binding protein [Cyclobacteriaceae bacterium]|nr:ATP-binding protein [Cyclobacteriaceae bacterium]